MLPLSSNNGAARRRKEAVMDQEVAPVRRRRMGPQGMMLRRRRIFARLRDGLNYEEIAAEEGVTGERIRQIVTEALRKRSMDSGADHAKLQLDRLAPVMQLAAEAVAAGDVAAIAPYLKVLDRIDRYQKVGGAIQVYDDEARKKLFDKLSRVASNLDLDEVPAAARGEVLKQAGMLPAEPGKTDGDAAQADAAETSAAPNAAGGAGEEKKWFGLPATY
jgi:DNA-binding CsgD family transcriptional regulator